MKEADVNCPVCNSKVKDKSLINRPDYEFGLTFKSKYWKCKNTKCGLVFVYPLPKVTEVSSFYNLYTTHVSNKKLNILSTAARISRSSHLDNLKELFQNKNLNEINVLDYGCGNGNLLIDLSNIGVKHVFGYDMDPIACEFATSLGLKVFSQFPKIQKNGPYDYIFLNHVIEHLIDPKKDMEDLALQLKPGGFIIIRTPNTNSFLANMFNENWRGWEVPRHLHIFNEKCIIELINKIDTLEISKIQTSNLMFSGIFNESFHSKFFRKNIIGKIMRKLLFFCALFVSNIWYLFNKNSGEELCLIAIRHSKK